MNSVSCDWERVRGAEFDTLISYGDGDSSKTDEDSDFDPNDFITMERAAQFSLPTRDTNSNAEPQSNSKYVCYMRLDSPSAQHISNIRLTSEAPKVEVFTGQDAEYFAVKFGELLDRVDDISVYLYEFQLPKGLNQIALKFFPVNTHFWIIGFHVQLAPVKSSANHMNSSINMQNVQNMLNASNVPISDAAEKCKRFLSMHMKGSKSTPGPPKFADMMAFVNQSNSHAHRVPHDKPLDENRNPDKSRPNNNGAAAGSRAKSGFSSGGFGDTGLAIMKSYFDAQLKEVEGRISKEFDKKLQAMEDRQNKRLDEIVLLLKTGKCGVDQSCEAIDLD